MKTLFFKKTLIALSVFSSFFHPIQACTRTLFVGSDHVVLTGRSMDWVENMDSDLWIFPKGIQRNGAAGPHSVNWISKYGSLIVAGYNAGTADGINEMGLVANVLYLAESNYGQPNPQKPSLSISLWAQYVLDQFSSVLDVVEALKQETFNVLAPVLPNGSLATLHLCVSDASGDSAIFEYINGKLVIHHGKEYQIMTNSPTFDKQLAINTYWETIGGLNFLPGTNRAADRFARASFLNKALPKESASNYITQVPKQQFINQALASVFGVIRGVSVPLGITTPGQPNIASTLWRTVADHKNKVYFFDSATSPNTFWVELKSLDFNQGSPVKKLAVSGGQVYSGNASSFFEAAEPFKFLSSKVD